ncbi:DUF3526 domain-containing protein [Denitromonas iodatirespirans]|uniref:DUF3526 domain-containing protein n=1 Tax=Denitromonas iodatirespirans TaxID=2795389 RepID=A0A944D914_DENI1|nr:DUF3526 domain-containing protein [Denitromonas iodatirespirans]MBT0962189.1 DUF3526 domain-containing protein [Denitromonas iodatirespirans]
MNEIRTFLLVVRHESRVLVADRSLVAVMVLTAILVLLGLYNGLDASQQREQTIAALLVKQDETRVNNVARLRRIMAGEEAPEPFSNPANPALVGGGQGAQLAVMPSLPLAPLAFGQSDLLPDHYRVSYRNKATFMYDAEIENPWSLLSGRFDLAFVLVYLLPLMICAMSYNLLSAEREQGILKLLMSQPLSLSALVLGKTVVRLLPLLAIATLLPAAVLLALRPDVRAPDQLALLAGWSLLTTAYALFWFALAAAANLFGRSSATNAIVLIAAWVGLVLVAPVLLNVLVAALSPAPSRIALATETRLVTIQGLNRYNELLSTDYRYTDKPELLLPQQGRFDVPARLRAFYLIHRDVDHEIEGVLAAFDRQLAGQQALVDRLGWLSPAVIFHEALASLAGTGARRHQHFKRQIDDFHREWRAYFEPRVQSGTAIQAADYSTMPKFVWQEAPRAETVRDLALRLLQIFLPVAVLSGLALRRLRRFSVVPT